MSTNAEITFYNDETKVYHTVNCNFDGYLSGVGVALIKDYNSKEKAETLFTNRNIRTIVDELEFYNDDYSGVANMVMNNIRNGEHNYMWKNGFWRYKTENSKRWYNLETLLKKEGLL